MHNIRYWINLIESENDLRSFSEKVKNNHGLKAFDGWMQGKDIKLNVLIVPREKRNQGLGSKAIEALTQYADDNNLRIILDPATKDDHHGTTSRNRLIKFYKRFGFIENKGRKKDFSVSGMMIRDPKNM